MAILLAALLFLLHEYTLAILAGIESWTVPLFAAGVYKRKSGDTESDSSLLL